MEIEEGFITFPTLPGGLLLKVGKMKAQFGKVNTLHTHALPWVDRPLVTQNLLGGDEGAQRRRRLGLEADPQPVVFLEATGEVYQGQNVRLFTRQRAAIWRTGRLRGYRDLTESTNVDVGGSSFASGHNDVGQDFTTRLFGVDATFRYRPLRRAIYRRFLGRTELFWSRRGRKAATSNAFGMYGQRDYQFARRWFAGAPLRLVGARLRSRRSWTRGRRCC